MGEDAAKARPRKCHALPRIRYTLDMKRPSPSPYHIATIAFIALASCLPQGCNLGRDPGLNTTLRLFDAMYVYSVGGTPLSVVTDDFNGDGLTDVATVNQASDNVSILLATDDLLFDPNVNYSVGNTPVAFASNDLNGDGITDLVTANANSADLSRLLGIGDGTFSEAEAFALPAESLPRAIAATDLNNDGRIDLLVADKTTDTVLILLATEAGDYLLATSVQVGGDPRDLVITDVNKDGNDDFLTANSATHDLSLGLGQGDGTFLLQPNIPVGRNPKMISATDLNNDLWPDLVVSNPGSEDFSVMIATRNGDYAAEMRLEVFDMPLRFTLADFNEDSYLDIAILLARRDTITTGLGQLRVFLGDGLGDFHSPRTFGTGPTTHDLHALDMNGDNRLDLLTTDTILNEVGIILGRGDGTFETDERFPTKTHPRVVAVTDLDDDQALDLVITNLESDNISILLGNGDATFQQQRIIAGPRIPRAMLLEDINEDNDLDLLVTSIGQSAVFVYLGDGAGTFGPATSFSVRRLGELRASVPRSIAVGDLDADGNLDIVTGNSGTDSIAILLGDGDGSFDGPTEITAANFPLAVKLADINHDNLLDAVFVSTRDPDNDSDNAQAWLGTLLGNGDGTFVTPGRLLRAGAAPRDLVLGHLDGDANVDAVVVDQGSGKVFLYWGQASGLFTGADSVITGPTPVSAVLHDINNDTLLDIIVTDPEGSLSVFLNRNNRKFGFAVTYYFGASPIAGVIADLENDGLWDFIAPNQDTNDISILLGKP